MEGYREEETYKIIGICMEVHRNLGPGLLEVVYKDALEIEFKENNIQFEREKKNFQLNTKVKSYLINFMLILLLTKILF